MKKQFCFFLCFIFQHFSLNAQGKSTISGYIKDTLNIPIPYTSLAVMGSANGTYSDINGYFILKLENIPCKLIVNNIGYKTDTFSVTKNSSNLEIILKERNIILREITISTKKPPSKYLGSKKNPKGIYVFIARQPFEQVALMVKNEKQMLYKHGQLQSISIKILSPTFGGNKPTGENQLRLRIYSMEGFKKESKDLLHENIYFTPTKAGWYTLSLDSIGFMLPVAGFVVALEWLENQPFEKWGKYKDIHTYGLILRDHILSAKEKKYYTGFQFHPEKRKWSMPWTADDDDGRYLIPCIRLEIREY